MAVAALALAILLSGSPGADVWPINQRNFRIPIRVDPARRAEIKELILFASTDQGKTWQQVHVAKPDDDAFPYYAATDGEYWFSVCVVDQKGSRDPADIYSVPPSQKVIVDTLKPLLRLTPAYRQADEIVVGWEIQEDHLDLGSIRLEYRPVDAASGIWYPAPLIPAPVGTTHFRVPSSSAVALRMHVQDQAGNQALATADVPAASPSPNFATAAVASVTPTPGGAAPWGAPPSSVSLSLERPGRNAVESAYSPAASPTYREPSGRLVAATDAGGLDGLTHPNTQLAPVQFVNSTQLKIDYEVTKKGPSGIGKVDLWMTRDDGRSWQFFAEDPDQTPPMTVELPGEGVYGFSLVIQSRAGLFRKPPSPGDAPEIRVEVDTTPPSVRLYRPEPDPRQRDALLLTWTVSDRNVAANPITLQWAEQRSGPWQLIASELPNSGRFTWRLPTSLPDRVYLRLIARDLAGNTSIAESDKPQLVDLQEPEGRIRGVATASPPP